MRRVVTLLSVLVLVWLLAACGSQDTGEDDGKTRVVATIGQLADIAGIVGGEQVHVDGLMGAGIDPHLYVASEGDVELLQNAEIIFYNGLFL